MRSISVLFVDIDLWPCGKLGQIGSSQTPCKFDFGHWNWKIGRWALLKYLSSKQNMQRNVFREHFPAKHKCVTNYTGSETNEHKHTSERLYQGSRVTIFKNISTETYSEPFQTSKMERNSEEAFPFYNYISTYLHKIITTKSHWIFVCEKKNIRLLGEKNWWMFCFGGKRSLKCWWNQKAWFISNILARAKTLLYKHFGILTSHTSPSMNNLQKTWKKKISVQIYFPNVHRHNFLESCPLTLQAPTPENGQTHSNKSSAVADKLFECVWPFCGVAT